MSVDPRSYAPKYAQVAAHLRERITSGEYPPGALLPSMTDLADTYEVGTNTVRRALAALHAEHLIVTEQGVRAQVREMGERTVEHISPGERVTVRPATLEETRELGLAEGDPVAVITGPDGTARVVSAYDVELVVDADG